MNLKKLSLAVAIAIAGVSTSGLAEATVTGSTDFRFKTLNDKSGFVRERANLDFKAKSEDGMGKAHVRLRWDKGVLGVNKAYVSADVMGMTVKVGPKVGAPGKLSDSTNSGIVIVKKMMGLKASASVFGNGSKGDKQLLAISGKAGMMGYHLDYQMGNKKPYLATLIDAKFGSAKLKLGYAMGMAEGASNSMLGATLGLKMGMLGFGAGVTMAGAGGGSVVELTAGGGLDKALGYYYGSQTANTTAFFVNASTNVAGHKIGAYFSSAGDKMAYQLSLVKKVNSQSTLKAYYTTKGDSSNLELRLGTKF